MRSLRERTHSIKDTWALEFLSLFGSLSSLATMVMLLAHYNNHPIFVWHGFTLNAYVSILSTAIKGWLIFPVTETVSQWKWIMFSRMQHRLVDFDCVDSASRGPLGTVQTLYRRTGGWSLTLGTLIILLAIAIDPFVQQLVHIQEQVIYRKSNQAVLPIATRYSRGSTYAFRVPALCSFSEGNGSAVVNETACVPEEADIDFTMRSAIFYGLSNSQSSAMRQLEFSCPSGNCTWDAFQSLAVCSKCEDVSDQLRKVPPSQETVFDTDSWFGSGSPPFVKKGGPLTTFSFPNGLKIVSNDGFLPKLMMTLWSTVKPSSTIGFQSNSELIYSTFFIKAIDNVIWPGTSLRATECALYYCVNEYTSKVLNGFLVENATQITSAKISNRSWQPSDTNNASRHDHLIADPPHFVKRTDLMLGNQYNVSQTSIDGIHAFFKNLFDGTDGVCYGGELFHMNGFAGSVLDLGWTLVPAESQETLMSFDPLIMQAFYQSTNLTDTFESIAWSMSNAIREGADEEGGKRSSVTGQNGILMNHYSIQWPWISLPITLILASYIFLCLGVYYSHKAKVPVWKSSSLAALARGRCVSDHLKGTTTISGMEDKAEGTFARLIDFGSLEISGTSLRDLSQTLFPLSRQSSPPALRPADLERGSNPVLRVSQDLTLERDVSEIDEDDGQEGQPMRTTWCNT